MVCPAVVAVLAVIVGQVSGNKSAKTLRIFPVREKSNDTDTTTASYDYSYEGIVTGDGQVTGGTLIALLLFKKVRVEVSRITTANLFKIWTMVVTMIAVTTLTILETCMAMEARLRHQKVRLFSTVRVRLLAFSSSYRR